MKINDTEPILKSVKHYLVQLREGEKNMKLLTCLNNYKFNSAMIFTESVERSVGLKKWMERAKVDFIVQADGQELSPFQKFKVFFGKKVNILQSSSFQVSFLFDLTFFYLSFSAACFDYK